MTKRRANRRVVLSDANQVIERALKAALDDQRLLGLIERHRWCVEPVESNILPPVSWAVESEVCNGEMAHVKPTLIEALTQASRCNRCCGRECL